MTSLVPDLDTSTFEELVERARGQIPRFAPAWTDHNLHDPGVTLIDLLAWIVDQQSYRIGFVGDRHLRAFAALLGVRESGPSPASGLVWPQRTLPAERSLGAGTAVTCTTEPEIPFVIAEAVHVSPAQLIALVVQRGGDAPVVVPRDGERMPPIALVPASPGGRTTLTMRFDRPLVGTPPGPVSIGFVVEPPPGEPPDASVHAWGPLRLEHRRGDEPWATAELVSDGTDALARTGAVIVEVPTSDASPVDRSELRLVIDADAVPLERRIRRIALNVLPVVQQSVDTSAPTHEGTGLPGQEVPFDTTDVVDIDALEVRVDEEVWESRTALVDAGPDDRVLVRRPDALHFGNGVNGRVPRVGATILTGPVTRTLGDRVRLRAGLVWNVPALEPDGDSFATNIDAIGGGRGRTDLTALLAEARRAATTRTALLTDEELAAAARLLPGFAVARAEVLDGFHPHVPGRRIDGTRTLVVIPHRGPDVAAHQPAPAWIDAVRAALEGRRVLGDRLIVGAHSIARIAVRLTLLAAAGTDPAAVRTRVSTLLRSRFSDVPRDDAVAPWPLGRTVTCEEVTALAAVCEGVLAVETCAIGRSGAPTGKAPIGLVRDEVALLEPGDLRVEVARS